MSGACDNVFTRVVVEVSGAYDNEFTRVVVEVSGHERNVTVSAFTNGLAIVHTLHH